MNKHTLAIINSDPIDCTYGGVAPIMRNMDSYLSSAFDVRYYYIPESWKHIPLPGRIKVMMMILRYWHRIRKSDAILSHVPEGSWLITFMNTPLVHIFHGNFNPMKGSKYRFGKYFARIFDAFDKRISKKAAMLYTVGPTFDNRKKLYNPIQHNVKPTPLTERSGFVFAGRLETLKNIDKIIRVYSSLDDDIKRRNKLYIAGDGTQREYLHALTASLGETDNVVFTGALDNTELVKLDTKRKILLMASTHEGLPTAIAEALTVGVPVVSTDVGDINRVIKNGYNGYLLPVEFSNADYIKAIHDILENYEQFSKHALESSSVFNARVITKELIGSINSLILENEK